MLNEMDTGKVILEQVGSRLKSEEGKAKETVNELARASVPKSLTKYNILIKRNVQLRQRYQR